MIFLCFGLLRAADQTHNIDKEGASQIYFSNTEDYHSLEFPSSSTNKIYTYAVLYNYEDFKIKSGSLKEVSVNVKSMKIKALKENINLTFTFVKPSSVCTTYDFHFGPLEEATKVESASNACFFLFGYPKISVDSTGFEKIYEYDTFVQLRTLKPIAKISKINVEGYTSENYTFTQGYYYLNSENHFLEGKPLDLTTTSDSRAAILAVIIIVPIIVLTAMIVGGWFLFQYFANKNNEEGNNVPASRMEPINVEEKRDNGDSSSSSSSSD
ncbi:hypothetical protein TVAG_243960 [Trichomonas vaginalis G3]|uniref:Uncharacterized protein n=1 Tax=Trichomonas vaginalis (strain ATCC PRA-98 / G3) TaxID=412133 RepID=A2G2H9_TRIV3|nr:hypothetical protein TVAGG3_0875050 [Trichomonas vaginalis G3]EAX88637.1 hypothetical protein TVAG_243960 [Trichomonas vaginalis G3]KAI5501632.1 hypothetical protein TVAGG3_0875050 [Trichomonas vaginalis G3]|eukprot:XP_001301567.1 hypothetical protein [Trichomonas vaginalis G3]